MTNAQANFGVKRLMHSIEYEYMNHSVTRVLNRTAINISSTTLIFLSCNIPKINLLTPGEPLKQQQTTAG